jgi:hypothetical protein
MNCSVIRDQEFNRAILLNFCLWKEGGEIDQR